MLTLLDIGDTKWDAFHSAPSLLNMVCQSCVLGSTHALPSAHALLLENALPVVWLVCRKATYLQHSRASHSGLQGHCAHLDLSRFCQCSELQWL